MILLVAPKPHFAILDLLWRLRFLIGVIVLVNFIGSLFFPIVALSFYQENYWQSNNRRRFLSVKLAQLKAKGPNLLDFSSKPIRAVPNVLSSVNLLPVAMLVKENPYLPYLAVGGVKYFNQSSNLAASSDLFIPLISSVDQLFFTDLRIFDRSGSSFEGNAHLGWRSLVASERQIGFYGSLDRRKSDHNNWFWQLTLGGEYWHGRWFSGINFYQPLTRKRKLTWMTVATEFGSQGKNLKITHGYEKALSGVDGEIGYELNEGLTGYAGGYFFYGGEILNNYGSKVRFTYDYYPSSSRVLDRVVLEAGLKQDRKSGLSAYLGVKFQVSLIKGKNRATLRGFKRHLIELVRRDPDIIIQDGISHSSVLIAKHSLEDDTKKEERFAGNSNQRASRSRAFLLQDLKNKLRAFGVVDSAGLKEVNAAYRKYVLMYHPDRNPNGDSKYIYYSKLRDEIRSLWKLLEIIDPAKVVRESTEFAATLTKQVVPVARQKDSLSEVSQQLATLSTAKLNHSGFNLSRVFITPVQWLLEQALSFLLPIKLVRAAKVPENIALCSEIGSKTKEVNLNFLFQSQINNPVFELKNFTRFLTRLSSVELSQLSEESVSKLEELIVTNHDLSLVRVGSLIVARYALKYTKNLEHIAFLGNLLKEQELEGLINLNLIQQISKDLTDGASYSNDLLDSLLKLLSSDNKEHSLFSSLIKAYQNSPAAVPSAAVLAYFMVFLDDQGLKEQTQEFINNSLVKQLLGFKENGNLSVIIEQLKAVRAKAGEFSPTLLKAVLEIYQTYPNDFAWIVNDWLARESELSLVMLDKLISSLMQIKNPYLALLIAWKLESV